MDRAEQDTPRQVRQRLAEYGGRNPYGNPVWRVVIAERRITKQAGIFHEFAGEQTQIHIDHNGRYVYTPISPERVRTGIVETPVYGEQGWILERWFPASMWGTRDEWDAQVGEDGITPIMGAYPVEGEYWMLGGPWEHLPTINELCEAIRVWEYERENRPLNFEMALSVHLKGIEDAKVDKYRKIVADLEQFRRSEILPVMHGTSLAAQGVRQSAQRSLGLTSHLGL